MGLPTLDPEIADLGVALGLLTPSGTGVEFTAGWFDDPGAQLRGVLAEDGRRQALVRFIDSVLGDGDAADAPPAPGPQTLHLFDLRTLSGGTGPDLTIDATIDDSATSYVEVGIGVTLTTTNPTTSTRVIIPLYRAAKAHQTVTQPFALLDGGKVQLGCDLTLSTTAPATDEFGLQGVQITISTALSGTPEPAFGLVLKGLHLPGSTTSADLPIGLGAGADLEHALLSLVLSLARQALDGLAGAAATEVGAALDLFGLGNTTAIPALPVEALVTHGVSALRDWFVSVLGTQATRDPWLGRLAVLLGGSLSNGIVQIPVAGPVSIEVGFSADTAANGHLVVTPQLGVLVNATISSIDLSAEVRADVLTIDTSNGAVTAVPLVEAVVTATGHGAGPLLPPTAVPGGTASVDSLRFGLSLQAGTPHLVLQALTVDFDGTTHPVLDLSSPDAAASSALHLAVDLLDHALTGLGPAKDDIKGLLGLIPTGTMPAITHLENVLSDPLGTLAGWWTDLLHNHPDQVPLVLARVRDLIASPGNLAVPVAVADASVGPWTIPIVSRFALDVSLVDGRLVLEPVVSLRVDDLAGGCTVVQTELRTRLLSLDLVARHAEFPLAVSFGAKLRGRGSTEARISLGPVAIVADYLGVGASWSPAHALAAGFDAPNLAIDADGTRIPLVLPSIDAHGHVVVPAASWDAVEQLVGVLALTAGQGWLDDLVDLLGWRIDQGPRGPKLALAALVADPAGALRAWLGALSADADLVGSLVATLARLTGGSADGLAGVFGGTGTSLDPWLATLGRTLDLPGVAVWMAPHGPVLSPSLAGDPLTTWQPGRPGLPSEGLARALLDEGQAGADAAALGAGRDQLAAGLSALAARWSGTDGMVAPPSPAVPNLTTVLRPNLHYAKLAALDLTTVIGGPLPPVVVRVASCPVAELPWTAPADRILDLTQPGVAPTSFTVSQPAAGEWFVALASRSDTGLGVSDPSGVAGQAARLQQVLYALAPQGNIALVALAGAGHAARLAADAVAQVSHLITLGSPWSGVAFDTMRNGSSGDALRLLKALLVDVDLTDDDDLTLAGALVTGSMAAVRGAAWVNDLEAPRPTVGVRTNLHAYGVFGVLDAATVQRATTAIFASGLAELARERAATSLAAPDATWLGVQLPFGFLTPQGGHGITLRGSIRVTLGSIAHADASITLAPSVDLEFALADTDGWLIGGPGTSPVGGAPALELRRTSGRVSVGLHGAPSSATLTLHEGAAFGTDWARVVVEAPTAATGTLDVQPLLPEARALLTGLTTRLAAAAPASPAGLFATLLHAVGATQADGAMVPDALAHLLHDPGATLRTVASGPSVGSLVAALAALLPGASTTGNAVHVTFGPLTATADPTAGTLQLSATGGDGLLHWLLGATVSAGPHVTVSATLGDPVADAFALAITSGPMRAQLLRPAGRTPVALWPTPDIDGLARLATVALPAEALRIVLEQVRLLDDPLHTTLEELLDALGMLGTADGNGHRAVRAPVRLFEDPVAWFKQAGVLSVVAGGPLDTERIISLFEALKPFLGLAGTPRGTWPVADGITVSVTNAADGPNLALAVDATQWLAGLAGREFAAGITLGLTLPGSGAPRPSVEVFVGTPDGAGGTTTPQHRSAAHVIVDASGLRIFLRPATGSDIEVFPHFAGLAALLQGATQLLGPAFDALAEMTGPVRGEIAAVVGGIGDGLALRAGGHFDGTALGAFAADPPGYLRTHLTTLVTQAGLALDPLLVQLLGLAAGQHAVTVSPAGILTVTVHSVVLEVHPSPLAITVSGDVGNLPVVRDVAVSLGVDGNGLSAWSTQVGPATLNLDGPVLRPFLRGSFQAGAGWEFDIGLGLNDHAPTEALYKELAVQWRPAAGLDVVVRTRVDATNVSEDRTDAGLAAAAIEAVLDLVGGWVLGVHEVQTLLAKSVGGGTVRGVLAGIVVTAAPAPLAMVPDVLGGSWSDKLLTLARNLAQCAPTVHLPGGVQIGVTDAADILGVVFNLTDGIRLGSGDTTITLEVDASWIDGNPPAGIVLNLLKVTGGNITPAIGVAVDGVGIRLGKSSGPLIDAGLRLDTVAVHLFGSVQAGSGGQPTLAGGVEIELAGLAVPLGGGGGDNAVAKGIMSDAGGSGSPPRPAFSPAIAIQGTSAGIGVSLRAGSGDGPWYLPIQRAFGPVYLEQVGLGVTYKPDLTPRQLEMISLYLDGRVSLLGLTASVQNLRFGYHVNRPFFDPASWEIDADGFSIAADFGPLSLAGGLVKFPLQGGGLTGVEYLGMLKISYASYGIDVFGGYAHPTDASGNQFASFFIFGALHAPLGGVPAFFITGVAIGFGINRDLQTPDIEHVPTHPFMQALRAGGPTPDPMQQLQTMRQIVPPRQGEFWVAAGISFTSFVLITGEILVTVQFGDGLDIAVLGVARAQLPTADVTLVSIELALLARFSTKEGLLLVQAQLTENSWLLMPEVHLTGGFAFATWWKGPNAGQFVVTVGGYHPRFSHDGYPVVPRVGLNWQPADAISVSGGVYFALCSEAIMAGVGLHAAAHLGPAHASLDFGGDGIVYFDPFYFDVHIYAEARVGITIWLLFGSVDIDISLGFDVEVEGPPLYIHGEFSVCGISIPFSIGSQSDPAERALSAGDFAAKYLRTDSDAQIVQASVVKGGLTAGKSNAPNSGGVDKVPDGSTDHPFRVVPEFIMTFVSTVPSPNAKLTHGAETDAVSASDSGLGVAPMYAATLDSTLSVEVSSDIGQLFHITAIRASARPDAAYPKAVWGGDVPNPKAPKLPTGNTVDASDGLTADATLPDSLFTGAPPIDYHQIELPLKGRKPLPFVSNTANTNKRVTDAAALRAAATVLTAGSPDADQRFLRAALVMSASGTGLTTVASLRGDRVAAPQFGSLADDLAKSPAPMSPKVKAVVVDRTKPTQVRALPIVKSVLGGPLALALDRAERTTVADAGHAVSRIVPTLDSVRAATVGASQMALQVVARRAQPGGKTMLPTGSAPLTRLASGPSGAVANAGPTPASAQRLAAMSAGLAAGASTRSRRLAKAAERGAGGAVVHEGELAVLTIDGRPAAGTSDTLTVTGGATRVICMAAGGRVLSDDVVTERAALALPNPTERVALVPLGTSGAAGGSTPGWYAGQSLPTLGWGAALGGGVVVTAQGSRVRDNRQRADGGWVVGRELAAAALVVTTFTDAVTAIAIVVDDTVGGDAAKSVSMRLGDAQRVLDADDEPLPPQVLVDGVRTILIYAVETTGANPRVFVDGCGGGQLAGVLGSAGGAASLAATLAATGVAAAVQQPLVGGAGQRSATITAAPLPRPPKPPRRSVDIPIRDIPIRDIKPAVKKTATKKTATKKTATKKTATKKTATKKAAAKRTRGGAR